MGTSAVLAVDLVSRDNNELPRPPPSPPSLEEPEKFGESSHLPRQVRRRFHILDCNAGRQSSLLSWPIVGSSLERNVGSTTHKIAVAESGAV